MASNIRDKVIFRSPQSFDERSLLWKATAAQSNTVVMSYTLNGRIARRLDSRTNATALANFYTAGAQLLPANSDFVRGTAAIRAFWQSAIDSGLTGASLETLDVEGHGDTAIEIGRYRLLAGGDAVADQGKYIVVWKKDDGAWKLHHDIWTTSQGAPGPSA